MAHCKLHTDNCGQKYSRLGPEQSRNAWICISKFTAVSLLWGKKKKQKTKLKQKKRVINLPAATAHLVHNQAEQATAHNGRAGRWE